ncbi:uncharacterized protein LOC117335218 [Pecten maximus]|uniref:uncharacterized protein LOC117335218 n=1 Tax=Pecten maximus TaxID=6579 RepID=UPI001458BF4D|nr:uncharacterized protein LOC117335218 [Pecten maximus]
MKAMNFIIPISCGIISLLFVDAKPKKLQCKFPTQWQSNVFFDFEMMVVAINQINGSGMFYYDYTNQQMRFDFTGVERADNSSVDFSLIWKFNEPAFYTIDNSDHSCEREDGVSSFWDQWEGIPADASPEYFGGIGGFKEIVGQYQWVKKDGGPLGKLAITMDVKVGDVCPPVRLLIRDQSQIAYGTFAINYEFLDNTGLKNPDVFSPPRNCNNNTQSRYINILAAISRELFV